MLVRFLRMLVRLVRFLRLLRFLRVVRFLRVFISILHGKVFFHLNRWSDLQKRTMEVAILYNKSNTFGLQRDTEVIQWLLKNLEKGTARVRTVDPLEPPVPLSVAIHLEVPYAGWMPWASTNYLLCNPEWYETKAWEPYLKHFDGILFRDLESKKRFDDLYPESKTFFVSWCCPPEAVDEKAPQSLSLEDGFVWFLGGSKNKREAAQKMLETWKADWPKLTVYTTSAMDVSGTLSTNVEVRVEDLEIAHRKRLAAWYPGHICVSQAEAFGYAAAEAEANGAFMILNDLEVYKQDYAGNEFVKQIVTSKTRNDLAMFANLETFTWDGVLPDMNVVRKQQKKMSKSRREVCLERFQHFWKSVRATVEERKATKPKHLPPVLMSDDCPPISVVTLLYNRRKFFDLACHNIMLSDYPKDKIEWVIVDDSDDPNEAVSDRVIQVGLKSAPLTVVYVPFERKLPISEKRNIGIKRSKNDIILFMDDDDHYPGTSFRRRVAWLTKHPWKPQCCACTTIACYDLLRGVSAVNTPPWNLPLKQRISEATLTFYKSWWEAQKFPLKVQIGEGEGFLEGREHEVLEMPPQQIIVAFSHKKNTSGRRIPADDAKPGCFWGFPKEYLIYIHKLAGVEVEEEKETRR